MDGAGTVRSTSGRLVEVMPFGLGRGGLPYKGLWYDLINFLTFAASQCRGVESLPLLNWHFCMATLHPRIASRKQEDTVAVHQ